MARFGRGRDPTLLPLSWVWPQGARVVDPRGGGPRPGTSTAPISSGSRRSIDRPISTAIRSACPTSYERGGLPELWLVDDSAQTVLVFRRSGPGVPSFDVALELGGGELLASSQLPGFELRLDELFRT